MSYQSLDVEYDQKCCGKTPKIKLLRRRTFYTIFYRSMIAMVALGWICWMIWCNVGFYCLSLQLNFEPESELCTRLSLNGNAAGPISLVALYSDAMTVMIPLFCLCWKLNPRQRLEDLCCMKANADAETQIPSAV